MERETYATGVMLKATPVGAVPLERLVSPRVHDLH